MSMRKKGEMVGDTAIEVIIGIAVAAVLILLMFSLFNPGYDEADEIAESYFERLENVIEIADSGGTGEIAMLDRGDKDLKFYLVYFGDIAQFESSEGGFISELIGSERIFSSSKVGENVICVCYWQGERNICRYCSELDLQASKESDGRFSVGHWITREGDRVNIAKEPEVKYAFSVD
jgi:hypothetical protein